MSWQKGILMSSDNGIYVLRFVDGEKEIFSAKEVGAIDNLDYHPPGCLRDKYVADQWGRGKFFLTLDGAMGWAREAATDTEYGAVDLGTYNGKVPHEILAACASTSRRRSVALRGVVGR